LKISEVADDFRLFLLWADDDACLSEAPRYQYRSRFDVLFCCARFLRESCVILAGSQNGRNSCRPNETTNIRLQVSHFHL
jgi:hypothetical protein